MNKKKLSLVFVAFFLIANNLYSQKVDTSNFSYLKNKTALQYKYSTGEYLGCAFSLECKTMKIIFYDIECDKNKRQVQLKGRIIETESSGNDTLGIDAVDIFLAQPVSRRLTRIRSLKSSSVGNLSDSSKHNFPNRSGDFIVETTFSVKDRLYFVNGLYDPIEYDIGRLLLKTGR